MRIISKKGSKDFYDYMSYLYDTSDDIVYVRDTKYLHRNIKDEAATVKACCKSIEEFVNNTDVGMSISQHDENKYKCFVKSVYVGIYPYVYMVPVIMVYDNLKWIPLLFDVLPYECYGDVELTSGFVKEKSGINLGGFTYLSYPFRKRNLTSGVFKTENRDVFRICESPVFILMPDTLSRYGDRFNDRFNSSIHTYIANGEPFASMVVNPVFTDIEKVNLIKEIMKDLTENRSVYNDIENFLWSMRMEPVSEPDNKTKIVNHGFDLKTSFRKM